MIFDYGYDSSYRIRFPVFSSTYSFVVLALKLCGSDYLALVLIEFSSESPIIDSFLCLYIEVSVGATTSPCFDWLIVVRVSKSVFFFFAYLFSLR